MKLAAADDQKSLNAYCTRLANTDAKAFSRMLAQLIVRPAPETAPLDVSLTLPELLAKAIRT